MPPDPSEASASWVMPWHADESTRRSVELASMAFRGATHERAGGRARTIVVLSLFGMAGLAAVSWFSRGLVRRAAARVAAAALALPDTLHAMARCAGHNGQEVPHDESKRVASPGRPGAAGRDIPAVGHQ